MPLDKLLFETIGIPSKSVITIDVLLQPPPALKGCDCQENGTKMLLQNLLWDSVMAFAGRILVPFVSVVAGVAQKAYERGVPKMFTPLRLFPNRSSKCPRASVCVCVWCVCAHCCGSDSSAVAVPTWVIAVCCPVFRVLLLP